jgi:hypothetical protein
VHVPRALDRLHLRAARGGEIHASNFGTDSTGRSDSWRSGHSESGRHT